jgi:DMSO/TMAO reductase YedYZ molybdopterin-dependent catalytic subunit
MVNVTRRMWLTVLGIAGAGWLFGRPVPVAAQVSRQAAQPLPDFTGPGANPYWNSTSPFAIYPEKLPLLRLTDRAIQLETPRPYFLTTITPNEAFYVRYHLDRIPNEIDLATWRLEIQGNVERPRQLRLEDLMKNFSSVSVVAVNQCSGNSRSRFQPRVPGGQWGNGAMGNAKWTGVPLRELLAVAGIKPGTAQIQFEGLDRGAGPEGKGSHAFLKSIVANDPVLGEAIVAYAMNDAPLPMLNGFPVRLVVPGKFATYWMKHLTWIRALTQEDKNFWMLPAYRIPDIPRGDTTPADVAAGRVKMVPIGSVNLPVRSFIIAPDGASKLLPGLPVRVQGIAFSGDGPVTKVEVSADDGKTWATAALGADLGPHAFRTWEFRWAPPRPGTYTLAVRATDAKGHVQPDSGVWNPGGYLWNKIERQDVVVGTA